MARREKYGIRDLAYSAWHRTLADHLSYIDLDAIEYCEVCAEPLAGIELAQDIGQDRKTVTVTRNLMRLAHVPGYLVFYSQDEDIRQRREEKLAKALSGLEEPIITGFRVRRIEPPDNQERSLTPEEYAQFLEGLRTEHVCAPFRKAEDF